MPADKPQVPYLAPRLLPLLAVAELCSLSPHTIRALVKRGKLRPTRVCRRLLFDIREVERFIAECH
jgi:hypothetical protein